MSLHFDLKDLRLFTAVELTGSITKASEYGHISPSALSERLHDLEDGLGIQLFQRTPRGMKLTEAGEVFSKTARRILSESENLEAELAPYTRSWRKRISLLANYAASVSFLPKRLGRFLSRYPDVQVDVVQYSSNEIIRRIALGEADIGITAFSGSHPLLDFTPFAVDTLVGIVPKNNPLSNRSEISFSDLFDYDYIAVGPVSAMQNFLYEKAEEEGRTIRPRLTASAPDAVMSLVEEGAGVSVLPSGVVTSRSGISCIKLKEAWAVRCLRLCRLKDNSTRSPEKVSLIESFIKTVAEE